MDMRCDSVDIATFLGVYGMAATRVNRGNNGPKCNETKQGSIYLEFVRVQLLVIDRSMICFESKQKAQRDDLREANRRMGLVR